MTIQQVKETLRNANVALAEIVNNSDISIKKLSMIVRLKRELQKIIDSDFLIIDTINHELDFDIENGFTN